MSSPVKRCPRSSGYDSSGCSPGTSTREMPVRQGSVRIASKKSPWQLRSSWEGCLTNVPRQGPTAGCLWWSKACLVETENCWEATHLRSRHNVGHKTQRPNSPPTFMLVTACSKAGMACGGTRGLGSGPGQQQDETSRVAAWVGTGCAPCPRCPSGHGLYCSCQQRQPRLAAHIDARTNAHTETQ